jgi:hypothetical protein
VLSYCARESRRRSARGRLGAAGGSAGAPAGPEPPAPPVPPEAPPPGTDGCSRAPSTTVPTQAAAGSVSASSADRDVPRRLPTPGSSPSPRKPFTPACGYPPARCLRRRCRGAGVRPAHIVGARAVRYGHACVGSCRISGGRGLWLLAALTALGCGKTLVVGRDVVDGASPDGASAAGPDGSVGPPSLTRGLLAHWPLDDGPGVQYTPDSSARGDRAIPEAVSPTDWITGRIRGALKFGPAAYLRGTVVSGLDPIPGLSMAMWIRLEDREDREQVIMQRQAGTGGDAHFLLSLRRGSPALSGLAIARCEGPPLETGRWVHLAATFDGATELLFYGGEQVTSCVSTGAFASDTTVLMVGGAQVSADRYDVRRLLHADLDEVALWNRALTPDEIRALAAGAVPPL